MNENRIYQLTNEQINSISSDLIEAIILISGKKDKQGILEVLNNYAKDIKENIIPDFRSIITTARSINSKQESVVLSFEDLDNKISENHQNFLNELEDNIIRYNKDFLEFYSCSSKSIKALENKLDEKIKKINFDNFEKQIQNKLDLKIKLFDDKLKELDKMNKDVNSFLSQNNDKIKNSISIFNKLSEDMNSNKFLLMFFSGALAGAGIVGFFWAFSKNFF